MYTRLAMWSTKCQWIFNSRKLKHEAETGKIQLAGRHKNDRVSQSKKIFDNSVQNTTSSDGQLRE